MSEERGGTIAPFSASRQIAFHQLLLAARRSYLMDALQKALAEAPPLVVKQQLSALVPEDVQRIFRSHRS